MPAVTKTQTLMELIDSRLIPSTGEYVHEFRPVDRDPEDPIPLDKRVVILDEETFNDFDRVSHITVTIEPGDTLNTERLG